MLVVMVGVGEIELTVASTNNVLDIRVASYVISNIIVRLIENVNPNMKLFAIVRSALEHRNATCLGRIYRFVSHCNKAVDIGSMCPIAFHFVSNRATISVVHGEPVVGPRTVLAKRAVPWWDLGDVVRGQQHRLR